MKNCAPQAGCKPLESKCVIYNGSYLSTLDIYAGQDLNVIFKKINDLISTGSPTNLELVGDVLAAGSLGNPITTTLSASGVIAGGYGTSSMVPVFTVDSKGRITSASQTPVIYNETDPVYNSQKGQPLGAATLTSGSKLTPSQFPNILDTSSVDITFNTLTNTLSADVIGYNPADWDQAYDNIVTDLSFNVANGDLTILKENGSTIVENLDFRYILLSEAGNFIQNQNIIEQPADFSIGGAGHIAGNFDVDGITTLNDLVVEGNATILSTITLGAPAKGTIAPNADSIDFVAGIGFDSQFGAGGRNNDIIISNSTGIVTFTQTPQVNGNSIWHNGNFPLSLSSPTNGQYLTYNGTSWVNTTTSFLTSLAHNHFIANVGGTNQFSIGVNEAVRFEGSGDTTISFNAGTKTITITSIPGSGGGGAVTSFNGRTGGVVSQEGDYILDMLGDTIITSPLNNQLLQYNGTSWVNITPTYISGNQTITLSSDITGSGTTSIAATIANNVVTYAKMQDVTAARLLGRYSAINGDPQEIQIGTGITLNSSTGVLSATGSGGTVTSVGLSLPSIFTVSGSPVTGSGTLTGTLAVQSANTVFAGRPDAGTATSPSFRTLVTADIPSLDTSKIVSGVFSIARGGTGLSTLGSANQLLRVNAGATALEYFTPTYLTGNQTITLSGDVTGSGATAITTTIANSAVTYAKIQNISASRLLGRYSATAGSAQEISIGTGLTLNTTTGVLSNTGVISTPTLDAVLAVGNDAINNDIDFVGDNRGMGWWSGASRRFLFRKEAEPTANFGFYKYDDAGVPALTATITRATSVWNFTAIPTIAGTAVWYNSNHPAGSAFTPTLSGANVLNTMTVNSAGHITALTTRALTAGDIGAVASTASTGSWSGWLGLDGRFVSATTGAPTAANYYGINIPGDASNGAQIAFKNATGYFRTFDAGVASSWLQFADRSWVTSNFAASSGSGNYIQAQTTSAQSASFRIGGIAMIDRAGSNSFAGVFSLRSVDGSRGASFQLNGDATPGLATWIHNGTTWVNRMQIFSNGNIELGGKTLMPSVSGIRGTGTGNANNAYFAFYESDGTTRQGYIGKASPSNSNIYITADVNNIELSAVGDINLNAVANGTIGLNNSTKNHIVFNANGVGIPTLTTRSVGTKLVLYPSLGATISDYAFGVESAFMWSSVSNAAAGWKWYAAAAEVARLSGTGQLSVNTSLTSPLLTSPSSSSLSIASPTGESIVFNPGGTTRGTWDSDGRLGIGTVPNAARASLLEVNGNVWSTDAYILGTTNAPTAEFYLGGSDAGIRTMGSQNLLFVTGGTDERMRILASNGNVGIGLTNPTFKLQVSGSASFASGNFTINTLGQTVIAGTVSAAGEITANGGLEIGSSAQLTIPTGAGAGKVLTSDVSGNASWQNPSLGQLTKVDVGNGNYSEFSAAWGNYVIVLPTSNGAVDIAPSYPGYANKIAFIYNPTNFTYALGDNPAVTAKLMVLYWNAAGSIAGTIPIS